MMIETIQNNQKNLNGNRKINNVVKLPKNIRQVGPVDGDKRIYIEDYVMTYMKQIAMKAYGSYHVAILLGNVQEVEGVNNVFISGAVEVEDILFEDEKVFGNDNWAKIYEDIKKYFNNEEIVGWYITRPGLMLEVTDYLYKIHIDNFAGNNKVLLMYDSIEREEAFYLYDDQSLNKQDGYYIFYEKNDSMQSYMIDHKDKESIEADFVDQTCISIRSVLERKSNQKVQRKRSLSVMYAAASVCAVFLLVVAITMLTGKGIRDSNPSIETGSTVVQNSQLPSSSSGTTQVNVQPGNISSIKDETVVGDKTVEGKDDDVGVSVEGTTPITPSEDEKNTQTKPHKTVVDDKKSDGKDVTKANETSTKPKSYTIKRGDTLGAISLKFYNTKKNVKKIMALNKIENEDTIYAGQKIKLP